MAEIKDIRVQADDALNKALSTLRDGLPVAIPTETVYGLACDATNPHAIALIYETKGRPSFNPLICHMSGLAMAQVHAVFDDLSLLLARTFWPGPLTLILPLKPDSPIHPLATAGLDTVGIRVPNGFAATLIAAYRQPLAAPSANRSGKISPTTAQHVNDDLGDRIGLILDAGPSTVGLESTIIRVENGQMWLLRPGGISVQEIEAATGLVVNRIEDQQTAIVAPGMLASHYAPSASVRINASQVLPDEALIGFGLESISGQDKARALFNLSPSGNLREAAANLFGTLKRADASGVSCIAVSPIPMDGLGEAINDRLQRAAAPRE